MVGAYVNRVHGSVIDTRIDHVLSESVTECREIGMSELHLGIDLVAS